MSNFRQLEKKVEVYHQASADLQKEIELLKKYYEENLGQVKEKLNTHLEYTFEVQKLAKEEIAKFSDFQDRVDDEIKALSDQVTRLGSLENDTNSKLDRIVRMYDQIGTLKQQVAELQSEKNNTITSFNNTTHMISEVSKEIMLRQRKQQNLVIYGIAPGQSDDEVVKNLISDVGVTTQRISTYRIGKQEGVCPLVVRFQHQKDRDSVYNNLHKLKGNQKWVKVSVAPDLTKLEYEEDRRIYMELLKDARQRNEQLEEGSGFWKIVGKHGHKRLLLIT